MRLLAILVLLCGGVAFAAPPQAPRPPQAPAAPCGCQSGGPCRCQGDCRCSDDYDAKAAEAQRRNVPLVLQVGVCRPELRMIQGVVHCRLPRSLGLVSGVYVGFPGRPKAAKKLEPDAPFSDVVSARDFVTQNPYGFVPPQVVMQPPPMMMPMMGGCSGGG